MTRNKYLIAQVVAKVMQFDTASQNKLRLSQRMMDERIWQVK